MKNYLIFAASLLALASCSSDDILGGVQTAGNENSNAAIRFDGNSGKISRATNNTGSTAADLLDHQFKIYGVKSQANNNYTDVFVDYLLWDEIANNTTTNTNGWEYVGNKDAVHGGTENDKTNAVTLKNNQTIKFWDYSSDNYHFVAGSPYRAFTFKKDNQTGNITSATITGLKGHINPNRVDSWTAATEPSPVYVAEPKIVSKSDYKKAVQFNFIRQQSKVRVGIYETIPGYKISEINFYKYNGTNLELDKESVGETTQNSKNVILTSETKDYFVGAEKATGTIKYDWTTSTPTYSFSYVDGDKTDGTALTKAQNWYGGEFKSGVLATTSAETDKTKLYGTDKDMESTGYFTVIPTPTDTKAAAILIKCDYTLTSEDNSGETIRVTGATAAIPAAFCKWNTNTLYTYLFKISQNTNGTTGTDTDPKDPAGLYPITFDAVVADNKDMTQGTITTVSTPSITTYQNGSVTADGIQYAKDKAIYATVATSTSGELEKFSTLDNIKVYKLIKKRTEADLQLENIRNEEGFNTESSLASLGNVAVTINNSTLNANEYISFTPTSEGYYAIQYKGTTTIGNKEVEYYTYKVVYVGAPKNDTEA